MTSEDLTKEFLVRRIKSLEDLDILAQSFSCEDKSFEEQWEYIKEHEYLTIVLIKRVFGVSYEQAKAVILDMVEKQAIKEKDGRYIVLSSTKVLNTLKTFNLTGNK